MENTENTTPATETENTSALTAEQSAMERIAELEKALAEAQAAKTAKVPSNRIVERRIYVNHKQFGTCITLDSVVYLAPAGAVFDPKAVTRCLFTVQDGAVLDDLGREWPKHGENPGCGPRCPAHLKSDYGMVWATLSHAKRAEIIKALAPAPAAAAAK